MSKLFLAILSVVLLQALSAPLSPVGGDGDDDDDDDAVVVVDTLEFGEDSRDPMDTIDLSFYGEKLYGIPDVNSTAQLVSNYTDDQSNGTNPEELGSYLEGDILIPRTAVNTRNGIISSTSRWPNAIVPYEIRGNFNARDVSIIEHAMQEYHRHTCIRFVPHTTESDYLSFVSGFSGCWSSVGRIGGQQDINLQSPGCFSKPGTVIHEIMHALGFLHEQNREERDKYVAIQYHNIQPEAKGNFDRAERTVSFGTDYDYGSIMHYSPTAFSSNGWPTIVPTRSIGNIVMGQREGFSSSDIHKLNSMYDCATQASQTAGANGYEIDNEVIDSFVNGFLTGLGYNDDVSF